MKEAITQEDQENKVPSWLRLDSAAVIYPPTSSRYLAAMFRLSVDLDHPVDKEVLSEALQKTLLRIPSFGYGLRQGLFWWYLSRIDSTAKVNTDANNPMLRINERENRRYLFRVRCYNNRIALEVFHAIADGTGGLTFLLTLTGEYIRLKYGKPVEYTDIVLNPKTPPVPEEYEDSFERYSRKYGSLERENKAYHVPGTTEEKHILNIITGIIPIAPLYQATKKYDCTITAFLVAVMIDAVQQVQEHEKLSKKHPIKISVPVNLRQFYPTKTLRNFSSYVNVGIETGSGHYALEEIIQQVKGQMEIMVTEKRMNSKITANVKMEKNLLFRMIPAFIKKPILSIGERIMGDRYCTNSLSNLGYISLPDGLSRHIQRMDFLLGRPRGKPSSAACISYGENLYMTFSRKIKEADTERYFFQKLVQLGIPVEVESNNRR